MRRNSTKASISPDTWAKGLGSICWKNGGGERLRAEIGIETYTIFGTGPPFLLFQIPILFVGKMVAARGCVLKLV
jgi:hypothetical protein